MSLPHPLGDTTPGDIFYPGSPSVVATDLPGPAGSRAVEFGEDGLSTAPNRMGYALAKNDEYIDARIEAKLSKMEFSSLLPAGGSGVSYSFAGLDVFVGDATYLPETQSVRDALIKILDVNYNEAIDVNGNRVVVKEIKNSGDSASIVGDPGASGGDDDGFYSSGAIIRFQTVDVSGSVVNSNYTLPDGVPVFIAHGVARTIESAATSGQEQHMRDALFAGTSRAFSTVPAAAFLTDGSKKMFGDLDLNGSNLINPIQINGQTAQDLTVKSVQELILQDVYTGMPGVNLAETGITALPSSARQSLVGNIDLNYQNLDCLTPNRFLNRTGSFTLDDTFPAPSITYPELSVILGNERVVIPSGVFPTTITDSVAYLVVNNSGVVAERTSAGVLVDDIPVYKFLYDAVSSFAYTESVDARLPWNPRQGDAKPIKCGPVQTPGMDVNDFRHAVELAEIYSTIGSGYRSVPVAVYGTVGMTSSVTAAKLIAYGATPDATVTADPSLPITSFMMSVAEGIFRDLSFSYTSATAGSTGGCIDSYSDLILQNCKFLRRTDGGFGRCIKFRGLVDNDLINQSNKLVVQNCYMSSTEKDIEVTATSSTGNVDRMDVVITGSTFDGAHSGFDLRLVNGGGDIVPRINISDSTFYKMGGIYADAPVGTGYAVYADGLLDVGSCLKINNCQFDQIGASGQVLYVTDMLQASLTNCTVVGCLGNGIESVSHTHLTVSNCCLNGTAATGSHMIRVHGAGSLSCSIKGNRFTDDNAPASPTGEHYISLESALSADVEGNFFYDIIDFDTILYVNTGTLGNASVSGNNFHYFRVCCLAGVGSEIHFVDNKVDGNNLAGDTQQWAVDLFHASSYGHRSVISNNQIYRVTGGLFNLPTATQSIISGNTCREIGLKNSTRVGIYLQYAGLSVVSGNSFFNVGDSSSGAVTQRFIHIPGTNTQHVNVIGNTFKEAKAQDVSGSVFHWVEVEGYYCRVSGNIFELGTDSYSAETMRAIYFSSTGDTFCQANDNIFEFVGNEPTNIWVIEALGDRVHISDNTFYSGFSTAATFKTSIKADNLTNIVVTNNIDTQTSYTLTASTGTISGNI